MRAILATLFLCLLLPAAPAETASHYGSESGRHTASGERFDPNAMTAAHRTLPFGTLVRVTYQGRSVVVRINDRGPFVKGCDIDLSQGAARRIGLPGVGRVSVDVIGKADLYIPNTTVAALEMSRLKIATWASIGFAVAVLAGWVVEAAVKWAVGWVLSHFQ